MTTSVILQDPDTWEPLIGVRINAIDADSGGILDNQTTDDTGYAIFEEGDFDTDRYYFQPLITRDRVHMLVVPPFGYELYGIDNNEDYVDGRQAWAVAEAGAVADATELQTSPDGTVLVHVDRAGVANMGNAYVSVDDGDTWAAMTVPSAGQSCASLAFAANGRLWSLWILEAGSDDGSWVYYSDNNGSSWTSVKKIDEVGLGFTYAQRIRVDRETGFVSVTRFGELGSSARYFKGGVGGGSFPTADSSGVEFSADNNGGTNTGLMEFTGGKVTVASSRGTGGSHRIRLHNMAENGSSFTTVYEKAPGGDIIDWAQLLYVGPGELIALYSRASGGTGKEGMLRSADSGVTWTEVEVPSGFVPRSGVYDDQLDVLYIFTGGSGSDTFYKLAHPMSAPTTAAEWEAQVGPSAGFDVSRTWQVTWVPK